MNSPQPSADFPFVFVEGNLGIPKKVLYALYLTAVTVPRNADPHHAEASTCVTLLLNPAHQTALNTRKRLVLAGLLSPEKELEFTGLLLCGPLDCAKQSVLWDHRRWCFKRLYDSLGAVNIQMPLPLLHEWYIPEELKLLPKIPQSVIRDEFRIIAHACETYPRNYHAWNHRHFIVGICYALGGAIDEGSEEYWNILIEEHANLRRWIDLHVSDYSSMHSFGQTQKLIDPLVSSSFPRATESAINSLPSFSSHALLLVTHYPSHESLWMFLRIALGQMPSHNRRVILEDMQASSTSNEAFRQTLRWFGYSSS